MLILHILIMVHMIPVYQKKVSFLQVVGGIINETGKLSRRNIQ